MGVRAGRVGEIAVETRIAVAAMIARAVARMHDLGVLHKDLKPANILIATEDGGETIRLADFGSGRLLDDSVLASFQITDPGSLDPDLARDEPRSGTLAYRAPELTGDAMPTAKSDIYALGMILYQLVVGDFSASLAPGWEGRIADPVLRSDILAAAEGDPALRLASAADLADRLETIDRRRADASAAARRAAAAEEARRAEEGRPRGVLGSAPPSRASRAALSRRARRLPMPGISVVRRWRRAIRPRPAMPSSPKMCCPAPIRRSRVATKRSSRQ